MNREQQEMALWREAYILALSQTWVYPKAYEAADAAVAEFRKRYPVEPDAPAPVWYDEPPFEKDGESHPCWVDGDAVHADVYWDDGQWWVSIADGAFHHLLNGRRVCPIAKPPEPTT